MPLDSRVTSVDVGALAHWVGQSQGKPVSKMSLSAAPLTHKKVVALCVVANEVLNSNSPEAENLIKADLARAASAAWDEKFLSDDAASDAEPAGVLAGVAAETAVTDIPQSLSLLMANFSGDLSSAVFVARPATLALMTGTAFPQLGIRGGLLLVRL